MELMAIKIKKMLFLFHRHSTNFHVNFRIKPTMNIVRRDFLSIGAENTPSIVMILPLYIPSSLITNPECRLSSVLQPCKLALIVHPQVSG
jgi:hypothetical protein